MLVATAGLLGVGIWQAHDLLSRSGSRVANSLAALVNMQPVRPAAKPDKEPDHKSAKTKGKLARGHRVGLASATELSNLEMPPPETTVMEVPVGSPFPDPRKLSKGVTRMQLVEKYGEPTMRASATIQGRLIERYYYVNNGRTKLTVATLEDGLLISAEGASH